jgi:Mn2+/Fe2+ NRAMP family transporter
VKKLFQVALGLIAAVGGYVDIGDLVFNTQAGATFGYQLLWVIPIGVLGIGVFTEMSGRVAAIRKRANFELVRERYGRRLGLITLIASLGLNLATVAAELGGIAFVLQYFFDVTYQTFVLVAVLGLIAAAWFLPFGGLERLFGYGGLALVVYVVAAVHLQPDWSRLGDGLVPHAHSSALYAYFVVGLLAAAFMPYEIYFYSSGGVEEGWTEKDLGVNRMNTILGYGLGGLLSMALVVVAAQVLLPDKISPDSIGTVALSADVALGQTGLVLAFVGILFAVGGAAIDSCFSGAYNLAQYQGWKWGKHDGGHRGAPRWAATWLAMFAAGFVIVQTGIDPVQLTEYSVVLSVVALPLTYWPILMAARDRDTMGDHTNGRLANTLGWGYFALICLLAVTAPILLVVTNGGSA